MDIITSELPRKHVQRASGSVVLEKPPCSETLRVFSRATLLFYTQVQQNKAQQTSNAAENSRRLPLTPSRVSPVLRCRKISLNSTKGDLLRDKQTLDGL